VTPLADARGAPQLIRSPMKYFKTALCMLFLWATGVGSEVGNTIVLSGIFEESHEDLILDPDSTAVHFETYLFRVVDGPKEIKIVRVSPMIMEGAPGIWEKVKGIKEGELVSLKIKRIYKGKEIPLVPENGELYIFTNEFEITERTQGEQVAGGDAAR